MPVEFMQCRKCGKVLTEEAKFCEHCGAPVLPDATPAWDGPKKKKGKGKFWLLGAASFFFVVGILIAVFFADIAAFTERLVLSPEMLMKKAVASVVQDMGSVVAHNGQASERPSQYRVGLYVNDTLKGLLSLAEGNDDWVSNLHLQITTGKNEDLQRTQLSLQFAEESVISLDVLQNEENAWIGIPELDRRYLMFDQNGQEAWNGNLPSHKDMMGIFRTYGGILFDNIHRVTKKNTTLEIEGVSQKVLKLTATARREDIRQALTQIVRELKEDETVRKLLNQGAGPDIHGEFVSALEALADKTDLELQIICYLDSRNNLIGVEAVSEEECLFYWAKAVSGEKYASRLTCGSFALTGNGICADGKQTGQGRLTVDGTTVLTYRCKDFSLNEKGFSGSLIFPVERYLAESPVAGLLNVEISVELAQETVAGQETFSLHLVVGEDRFAGLTITEDTAEEFAVERPEQTLPADEETIEKWLESLDWSTFLQRIYDAGVPINGLNGQMEE